MSLSASSLEDFPAVSQYGQENIPPAQCKDTGDCGIVFTIDLMTSVQSVTIMCQTYSEEWAEENRIPICKQFFPGGGAGTEVVSARLDGVCVLCGLVLHS